ncbi:MAG: hypothetical protein CME06_00200 [Gemmatimonadetes bacterium]|nr:hypothetical protein [Gemmatimonadota bacterium]
MRLPRLSDRPRARGSLFGTAGFPGEEAGAEASAGPYLFAGELVIAPGTYRDVRIELRQAGARLRASGVIIERDFPNEETDPNSVGLRIEDAPGALVEGLTVRNYGVGIFVSKSDGAVIRDAAATGNRQGMRCNDSRCVDIVACWLSYNDGNGLDLRQAKKCRLVGNTIVGNLHDGLYLLRDSSNCLVEGNAIEGNGDEGVGVGYCHGTVVRYNTILGNGHGLLLFNADGAMVEGNDIAWNQDSVVLHSACDEILISENRIAGGGGIHVDTATRCRITRNRIETGSAPAITLGGWAHNNRVGANIVVGAGEPLRLTDSAVDGERFRTAFERSGVFSKPMGNLIDEKGSVAPERPVVLDIERIEWSSGSPRAKIVPRIPTPDQDIELLLLDGPEGSSIDKKGRIVVRRPEYDRPHVVLALARQGIALAYETVFFEVVNEEPR